MARRHAGTRKQDDGAREGAPTELATVIDLTPFMMARCSRDLTYRFVSRAYAAMLGRTPDQITGRPIAEIIGEEQFQAISPYVARVLEGEVVQHKQSVAVAEAGARELSVVYTPERDANGEVIGWVASMVDVGERTRAERTLEQSEQRFRALVTRRKLAEERTRRAEERFRASQEASLFGFTILNSVRDRTGAIVDFEWEYVNPAAGRLLRRPADQLVGRRLLDVLPHNRESTDLFERYVRVVESGAAHDYELYYDADGIRGWFHNMAVKLEDGVAVSFADVTERHLRETAMQEVDRRKDQFLAILGHELRNPMAPIRTGLELLRVSSDKAAALERLQPMFERQVSHMVRLIDDLLDVSRITSGRLHLDRRPTALQELVHSAIDNNRAAIEAAGLRLAVDIPAEPWLLEVDPVRFVQVLSNLLHNATKFTDRGGHITLTARVGTEHPQPVLRLTVSDTGIGIARDMLPRIFDLFVQDHVTDRSRSGLGIGLALARHLVEMHGGHLTAASAGPNCGSAFTIEMPGASLREDAEPEPVPPHTPLRRRVLIIDDNLDAAATLAALITTLGGEARTATTGTEGCRVADEFRPQVIFLDVDMPGMDGYETCRRLRSSAGGRDATIVALTGWGHDSDRQHALEAGCDAHLTKPADLHQLELILGEQPTASSR